MPYGTTHLEMGRRIQIIRERTALTQKDVAQFLSVTPKTASNWESGRTSISEEHLRSLIRLLLSHHAFSPGREGKEEIVALWKQAQACSSAIKELDHVWLSTQLRSRKQWEGIMELPVFFGRKTELAHLTQWITHEHSRLVTIFGVGGIGKTTLATKLAQDLAFQFECVLWHSLQYVPSIEDFVADCIQMLVEEEEQAAFSIPLHLDQRLACFLHLLRTRRCLLILDNFESLLREDTLGVYQPGFEGYQRLIELVVKSPHKSCLVITSREAPQHLRNDFPVRLLPLGSLNVTACQDLLREKSLQGTAAEWEQLIACYGGNPLGL